MTWLLMCFSSVEAQELRAKWTRLNISFESEKSVYLSQMPTLLKASWEIADLVTTINEDIVPNDIGELIKKHRIVIIFEKTSSTDAMFFPPDTYRRSNEWIITINPSLVNTPELSRLVTHEYFHLIHHTLHPNEVTWIREGLAQLFEAQVSKSIVQSNVLASLSKSEFSLEDEFDFKQYKAEQYGTTFLYFSYLQNQCGNSPSFIWDFLRVNGQGRKTIDDFLTRASTKPQCKDFISSAEHFSLSRLVNAYSGFEQNQITFLTPSMYRLKAIQDLDPRHLGTFRPMRLTLKSAQSLLGKVPSSARWWALEINYPNRVKRINEEEIGKLTKGWDIGLILVE